MRSQRTVIAVVALALLLDATARAQSLVSNGQFNSSSAGWSASIAGSGTASFDATRDGDGSPSSGSAELSTASASNGNVTLSQCFTLASGENVIWGGRLRYRESEAATGNAFTVVVFFLGPGCTGSGLGISGTQHTTAAGRGIWLDSNFDSPGFAVPADTQSATLSARVNKTSAGGVLTINADKLFFARVSSPRCNGQVPTKIGTSAGETIDGTSGTDIIAGLGGADLLRGFGGFDTLCGGGGDDILKGGGGPDILIGGPGDDQLVGGAGNDDLRGGTGVDDCAGGPGPADLGSSCETSTGIP